MTKLKHALKVLIEWFALWLLRLIGSEICVLPMEIHPYLDEITTLCEVEDPQQYETDDLLGQGYFKSRRVMTKMLIKYPYLPKRALWKAVERCSGSSR
ncbi:MAG: hypothetical protein PHC88_05595 [Terrimicrobiaceae bacterium]|nr:hypothetical protein [Terrimicrobiaceae bacterium]